MLSEAEEKTFKQLLSNAESYLGDKNIDSALHVARQAASINPNDPQVKRTIQAINDAQSGIELNKLCRKFLETKLDKDAESALAFSTRDSSISPQVAKESMLILSNYTESQTSIDELTAILMEQSSARSVLIEQLKSAPTVTFNHMFDRGDKSMNALTNLLLDKRAWSSEEERICVERDVFQLSLAALMKAGVEFPDRAMEVVSRLLGADAKNLNGLMDADVFDVILSNLDIRLSSANLKRHARLASIKLLQSSPDTAKSLMSQYVIQRIKKPTRERLTQALSAAAALFPIEPTAASELFLAEGFLPNYVALMEKWQSSEVGLAALDVLDAACMDFTCREAIRKYCTEWLTDQITSDGQGLNNDNKILQSVKADLVLEKISQDDSAKKGDYEDDLNAQEERVYTFQAYLENITSTEEIKNIAIEGLAFSSVKSWAKEAISRSKTTLTALINLTKPEALLKTPGIHQYGIWTILYNLTSYRIARSEEEQKLADLKAFASGDRKPIKPVDPLDDDTAVTTRCKRIVASDISPFFGKKLHNTSTRAANALRISMINSLCRERDNKTALAQHGIVKYLLWSYETCKEKQEVDLTRILAHALARILVYINPAIAFASPTTPMSALAPLAEIVVPPFGSESHADLMASYEALIALTNLASMSNQALTHAIIDRILHTIEVNDLFLHPNHLIQRSAVELLMNLSNDHNGIKFFDNRTKGAKRLHTMVLLANSTDLPTRRAATGILAMASASAAVSKEILAQEDHVGFILKSCEEIDRDVLIRNLTTVKNLIRADKVKMQTLLSQKENASHLRAIQISDPTNQLDPNLSLTKLVRDVVLSLQNT